MGGGKASALKSATNVATENKALEDQRAQQMQDTQQQTRDVAASRASAVDPTITSGLTTNVQTGGYDPGTVADITGQLKNAGAVGGNLAATKPLVTSATDASYGRGREGYQQFADTGGFTPEERAAFVRSSTRAAGAGYAANQDQLNRRLAIQGGYMPGFTSSAARLTRQGAEEGAQAATDANVRLQQMINANKMAGLGGLETTREAAGKEAQAAQDAVIRAQTAGAGAETTAASAQTDLAKAQAQGSQQAMGQLLDYYKTNLATMSDADKLQINNRLAQLGMTQAQINAFLGSAGQQKSGLDYAGSIINDVLAVGGSPQAGRAG